MGALRGESVYFKYFWNELGNKSELSFGKIHKSCLNGSKGAPNSS